MAKRKNSTALFEVMAAHRARQQGLDPAAPKPEPTAKPPSAGRSASAAGHAPLPPANTGRSFAPPPGQLVKSPARPGLMSAGKKWFGAMMEQRRLAVTEAAAAAAQAEIDEAAQGEDPTAGVTAQTLAARNGSAAAKRQTVSTAEPAPAPAAEPVAETLAPVAETPAPAAAAPRPEPVTYTTVMPVYGRSTASPARAEDHARADNHTRRDALDETNHADPDAAEGRPPRGRQQDRVAIDRDKHEVTLKVRFQTAAIGLTLFLVVVGVAYLLGKHFREPARPAAGTGSQAQPNALDPRGKANGKTLKASGDPQVAGGRIPAAGRDEVTQVQPSAPGGQTSQVTPPPPYEDAPIVNTAAKRMVGLNYVVIKTYAADFQATAIEVSDYLNANGVPNTIEIGSPAIHCKTGDFVITGTRGFTKGHSQSPEYEQYMQLIQTVAAKFPQKTKLNKPQPMTVKWPG